MLKIRKANKNDEKSILKILKELDLFYPSLALKDFWVAEKDNKIVGAVKLEELGKFFFLSSLCILPKLQKQGIGSALMKETLKATNKNVCLYTIIPEYFKKFGFRITAPPPFLPSKEPFECEYCHPEKCVCMIKDSHVA